MKYQAMISPAAKSEVWKTYSMTSRPPRSIPFAAWRLSCGHHETSDQPMAT
jgi:hypothetical protein